VYCGTWVHLSSVFHKSLAISLRVWMTIPPIIARQQLSKHVPTVANRERNRGNVERVCQWLCLCVPLTLSSNNSVKTFPRQRKTVGGILFLSGSCRVEGELAISFSKKFLLNLNSEFYLQIIKSWWIWRLEFVSYKVLFLSWLSISSYALTGDLPGTNTFSTRNHPH
jgi:hypothetical protein